MKQRTGTNGQQVAQEIVLIRAALKAQGYPTRKQPKQAIWTIQINPDQCYQLTFQSAPDRAWVLHPFEQTPTYQHLSSVIRGALAPHSTLTEASPMTYADRLSPWCIIRALPNLQRLTVARFRRRNDAEAHLKTLRRMVPSAIYEIVFDPVLIRRNEAKSG